MKLTQETIAIVMVGLALAGLDYYGRNEARADREAIRAEIRDMRAEARADRAAWQAESQRIRAENRADREAWQAEMRALREDAGADREAVSRLNSIVEQMRTAER